MGAKSGTAVVPHQEAVRLRWGAALAIGLTLGLLWAAMAVTREQLRRELRAQLAHRDGQLVAALLQKQVRDADAGIDPLVAVLETSLLPDLPGVLGARVFGPDGRLLLTLLGETNSVALAPEVQDQLKRSAVYARFLGADEVENLPRIEISLPLRPEAAGARKTGPIAQFVLEAADLAAEFEVLDRNLHRQSWRVFGVAGAGMVAALLWAFGRLERSNRLLGERTSRLLRANHELTLAARTSAVGAVASHLVHGLKNPLAGLQSFVSSHASGGGAGSVDEWSEAAATARRMKGLIDDVVRVLRDENQISSYELSLSELTGLVGSRLSPLAAQRGVNLITRCDASGELPNKEANLVLLILENLIANALQATPAGKTVELGVWDRRDGHLLQVRDEGGGLPEHVREQLFTPVASSKEGGSGLGLAISHQLARHLGAELALEASSTAGTVFSLRLPRINPVAAKGIQL